MDESRVIEEMGRHTRRMWVCNKRIVAYIVDGDSREIVDEWGRMIEATAGGWPPDQLYLAAHDLRKGSLTPMRGKKPPK